MMFSKSKNLICHLLLVLFLFNCSPIPSLSPDTLNKLQGEQLKSEFKSEISTNPPEIKLSISGKGYFRLSKKNDSSKYEQDIVLIIDKNGHLALKSDPDFLLQPAYTFPDSLKVESLTICSNGNIRYKKDDDFITISFINIFLFPEIFGSDFEKAYEYRAFTQGKPISEDSREECQEKKK